MKSFLPPIWLSFLILVVLLRCSSTPIGPSANPPITPDGREVATEDVERFLQALAFDKFALRQTSKEEELELVKGCESNDSKNPFCYSILNFQTLTNPPPQPKPPRTQRQPAALYPKVKKGKITNWYDLRFSGVQPILRGLNSASPKEIEKVREYSLKEKSCPNNAAIAIAAHLEDRLPDRVSYEDLAKLYEKGAHCTMESASDQEIMLTRAGIFYFAANQFTKAKENFERSVALDRVYRARALYWLYRTHLALKNEDAANDAYLKLKTEYPFTFHTLVILTSKNLDPGDILNSNWDPRITRSEARTQANVFIEQFEILKLFRFDKSAAKVLEWALSESQGAEPQFRMYLLELQENDGNYLSRFALMSDVLYKHPELISRKTMEQYFPKVLFPLFEKNSLGVDPLLLQSIARRESAFNARAVSSANARGLLQVTPGTLKEMRLKKDLFDPESNVFAGAKRFSDLLGKTNGQIHLALAAYNAGPRRIDQWMSRYPLTDPILFIDLIPFRETREYVAAVLRNYYWYRRIHEYSSDSPPSVLGRN